MPYVIHKKARKVKVGLTSRKQESLRQAGSRGGYKTKGEAQAAAKKLRAKDAGSTYTVKKVR